MHKRDCQIIDKADSKNLTEFLCKEEQLLLPLVELITHTEITLDELIDIAGRAAIEAVLTLPMQAFPYVGLLVKSNKQYTQIDRSPTFRW